MDGDCIRLFTNLPSLRFHFWKKQKTFSDWPLKIDQLYKNKFCFIPQQDRQLSMFWERPCQRYAVLYWSSPWLGILVNKEAPLTTKVIIQDFKSPFHILYTHALAQNPSILLHLSFSLFLLLVDQTILKTVLFLLKKVLLLLKTVLWLSFFNFQLFGCLLVLSYAKNFGIRRAISSGNPEQFKKLDMIWQP